MRKFALLIVLLMARPGLVLAVPTPTPTISPDMLARETTLRQIAASLQPTGTQTPGVGPASAANQLLQLTQEQIAAQGITTLVGAFGMVPSPTATPSIFSALRNQILFRDIFIRPNNSSSMNTGANNSAWITAPGATIGILNNTPYVVVSAGNDSCFQSIASPDAFIEFTMSAEYIAGNMGANLRAIDDDESIEVDSLGNGSFNVFDLGGGGGAAQTRFTPGQVAGNRLGIEIKGRNMNFYINGNLIDSVNLDTAGFDGHLNAATKFGFTLYGEDGTIPTFSDFYIEPFKQQFLPNPPADAVVFAPRLIADATPVVLVGPTPGVKHDFYITENNKAATAQDVGQLNTGIQYYGDFNINPAMGVQQLFCPDAIGNTTTTFTGHAGNSTYISGFFVPKFY